MFGLIAVCQTLHTQRTRTAITDASSIHDAYGAIMFNSPFLRIEWMVGRTAERAICLLRKVCSREDANAARSRPLRCPIDDRGMGLLMGIFQNKTDLLFALRVLAAGS